MKKKKWPDFKLGQSIPLPVMPVTAPHNGTVARHQSVVAIYLSLLGLTLS